MRIGRAGMAVILLAIVFIAFSAGFLGGRMTAGDHFTISAQTDGAGSAAEVKAYSPGADTEDKEDTPNPADLAAPKAEADSQVSPPASASSQPVDEPTGKPKDSPLSADSPININTCDADALMQLPSIGKTRAADIVAYREANGPFRSIADIMQVSGIGEATYDKIKKYITLNETP